MLQGDRIKNLRKERKLTQKELGELIDGNEQTIYKLEKRKNGNSRVEVVEKVAKALDTSTDYLLGLTNSPNLELVEIVENNEKSVLIPVYGKVAAGVPIEALEVDYGWIPIEKKLIMSGKRFIGLKVKGDSMYPYYMDGDTVIIEINPVVESGDDVVAYIGYDFEATLKRFHWEEDGIALEPLNREYPIKHYGKNDNPVRILGKVVEVRRKV